MEYKSKILLPQWTKVSLDSTCTVYLRAVVGKTSDVDLEVLKTLSFKKQDVKDRVIELTHKLDQTYKFGFAAVVYINGATAVIADRNRSIPIFYKFHDGVWNIGSAIQSLRSQGHSSISVDAYNEFWTSGFITSRKTLLNDIDSVDAGEIHFLFDKNECPQYYSWYEYKYKLPSIRNVDQLQGALRCTLDLIFSEIALRYSNKKLCVPLSGGFDSRLIATMLKRHGLTNVLCFSYGVENSESSVSQVVAKSLGFDWKFIKTNEDDWKNEFERAQVRQYQLMGSNLTSTAHLQDWLAVKKLIKELKSADDLVFLPGHSGDFLAGSHLPDFLFLKSSFREQELVDYLTSTHHCVNPHPAHHQIKQKLKITMEKMFPELTGSHEVNSWHAASICDTWNWKYRQSKIIINSVRVYEFFECDWILPLWHSDFMDLWARAALDLKRERKRYNECVTQLYMESADGSEVYSGGNSRDLPKRFNWIKELAKRLKFSKYLGRIYHFVAKTNLTDDHLGWRGRYPDWPIDDLIDKGYTCDVGFNIVFFLSSLDDFLVLSEDGHET
jgi:asparagine synthase (glutamine-hydrolysing)